jgi:hypothetical protein
MTRSASSDEGDDLEAITVDENGSGMLRARHDLAVALDGDTLAGETELTDQHFDGGSVGELPRISIDDYVDARRHRRGKYPPMTREARCDDHDIHALVRLDLVKVASHSRRVGHVATVENYVRA